MSKETRPNKIDFLNKIMGEVNEQDLNLTNTEKKLLLEKLIDLYDNGWWDSEADITIQSNVYEFVQGFIYYKIKKDEIMEE